VTLPSEEFGAVEPERLYSDEDPPGRWLRNRQFLNRQHVGFGFHGLLRVKTGPVEHRHGGTDDGANIVALEGRLEGSDRRLGKLLNRSRAERLACGEAMIVTRSVSS